MKARSSRTYSPLKRVGYSAKNLVKPVPFVCFAPQATTVCVMGRPIDEVRVRPRQPELRQRARGWLQSIGAAAINRRAIPYYGVALPLVARSRPRRRASKPA